MSCASLPFLSSFLWAVGLLCPPGAHNCFPQLLHGFKGALCISSEPRMACPGRPRTLQPLCSVWPPELRCFVGCHGVSKQSGWGCLAWEEGAAQSRPGAQKAPPRRAPRGAMDGRLKFWALSGHPAPGPGCGHHRPYIRWGQEWPQSCQLLTCEQAASGGTHLPRRRCGPEQVRGADSSACESGCR